MILKSFNKIIQMTFKMTSVFHNARVQAYSHRLSDPFEKSRSLLDRTFLSKYLLGVLQRCRLKKNILRFSIVPKGKNLKRFRSGHLAGLGNGSPRPIY